MPPTKGPYEVVGEVNSGLAIVAPSVLKSGFPVIVATVHGPYRGVVDDETRATANLLAAAPLMLAALECEEASDWDESEPEDRWADRFRVVLDRHGWDGREEWIDFIRRLKREALAVARKGET